MSALSNKLTTRLWITAVTVGIAFGVSFLLLYRVGAVEIRPLRHQIADLPHTIDTFSGVDHEMDEKTAARVNALESVGRKYTNPDDVDILVHIAAFSGLGEPSLPHPPKICYPGNGWRVIAERPQPIEGLPGSARLLTVEKEGTRSLVLYWYCWDNYVCTTRAEAIMTRLKLAGRSQWPPVVKVLIEMPLGKTPDATPELLAGFAAKVREETDNL